MHLPDCTRLQLLARIFEHNPEQKVILFTASRGEKGPGRGLIGAIPKPFDPSLFLRTSVACSNGHQRETTCVESPQILVPGIWALGGVFPLVFRLFAVGFD